MQLQPPQPLTWTQWYESGKDDIGIVLAMVGIALGVLGMFVLTPLMAGMLYDVAPRDLATFAAAGGSLASASLLTSWCAAARVARVDPVVVLRGL